MIRNKSFIGIGIFVIILLVTGMVGLPANADMNYTETEGQVQLETDQMSVFVIGNENVPKYQFRAQNDTNTTKHMVQFTQLFEFNDTDDDGLYNSSEDVVDGPSLVSLSSLSVNFTSVEESNNGDDLTFNITVDQANNPSVNFEELTFVNHLSHDNQTNLKFDVVINGYQFANEGFNLGLSFVLTSTSSNETTTEQGESSNSVMFGNNAYFETSNDATTNNEIVEVGMSTQQSNLDESNLVYLSYSNFTGDLVHDPSLGVISDDTGPLDTDESDTPINILFGIIGFIALVPLVNRYKN